MPCTGSGDAAICDHPWWESCVPTDESECDDDGPRLVICLCGFYRVVMHYGDTFIAEVTIVVSVIAEDFETY